jgi:sugar/nucleoside kinase (ribokinase family)
MQRVNEVVCAGILVADHICTPMERLPEAGALVAVDAMYLNTGGCAANVALDLARQDVGVSVAGKIGDDYWGRFVREDLAGQGIDTSQIRVTTTQQTSQTMILLCKGEDRRFVHTFGANREFRVDDVDRDSLTGAKVLYLGGYLVLPSVVPDDLAALFRHCRSRGIRTVLDVVVPAGFTYDGELEPVLPHTDVFLPNDDEALMLTGERDPLGQVAALRARGTGTVVVTRGSEGLLFSDGSETWAADPLPVDAIDPTGAGDAFCAGFITGMVRGLDLPGCVHYGSTLGASCVRALGACGGVFTTREAEAFLAAHPLRVHRVA